MTQDVEVLPERQWLKVEGDYVDTWYGQFVTPKGVTRRCGHQHREPGNALRCVRTLRDHVYREAHHGE